MLDARRQEVYTALYQNDGQQVLAPSNLVLDADRLAEQLSYHSTLFFGSGAAKFQPLVAAHPNAVFLAGIQPSASSIGVSSSCAVVVR